MESVKQKTRKTKSVVPFKYQENCQTKSITKKTQFGKKRKK